MKYLIDERKILGLINAGRITAEDLGLREYTGYLPAMGDVPYAHDGLWDTYLALPKEDARVRRVTVIGKPNSWERKCKNNRVVLKVHSHRETRTIFARYADALDLCIDREMRYHRAERRQLDLWLKARAPFNHTAK